MGWCVGGGVVEFVVVGVGSVLLLLLLLLFRARTPVGGDQFFGEYPAKKRRMGRSLDRIPEVLGYHIAARVCGLLYSVQCTLDACYDRRRCTHHFFSDVPRCWELKTSPEN